MKNRPYDGHQEDAGTVRVTFDMDVRAAVGSWDIFDSTLPAISALEPGKLVTEVNFTEYLPQIVRNLLPPHRSLRFSPTSYS